MEGTGWKGRSDNNCVGDYSFHIAVTDFNDHTKKEVQEMIDEFHADHYATGLAKVVTEIGEALKTYFPYEGGSDKNELPDDIVFGN